MPLIGWTGAELDPDFAGRLLPREIGPYRVQVQVGFVDGNAPDGYVLVGSAMSFDAARNPAHGWMASDPHDWREIGGGRTSEYYSAGGPAKVRELKIFRPPQPSLVR